MTELVVGIQGESGSFHEAAGNEFYTDNADSIRYVPFASHELLLHNLFNPNNEIHEAVIAVDNNTSGRVLSAINALREHPEVRIIGSITLNIDQHLLLAPGHDEAGLQAVISQQPALDQCEANIKNAGYKAIPYYDTAAAARRVRDSRGRYQDFTSVAAIGSRVAGDIFGLSVGSKFNDIEYNATKFWILSDVEKSGHGSHTALTFEVSDRAGSLHRAIGILSMDFGYNLTDIDSHLASKTDRNRAFFAEIEHGDSDQLEAVISKMMAEDLNPQVLGQYSPKGSPLAVEGLDHHLPEALKHDEWSGRHGLKNPNGSAVLYVETDHTSGSLFKVLGKLASCNLVDLGRPTVPIDHQFNRGFYIVIDATTQRNVIQSAIESISQMEGFSAEKVSVGELK